MTIHVVRSGDSIFSIARAYGVTPDSIISANQLANPSQLVVGQTIVIPSGDRTYTVKQGDSVYSIARANNLSVNAILEANPTIGADARIFPGQVITIPASEKLGTIEVNGYIFPGSNEQFVRGALPSLTYLSIFSYQAKEDGSLTAIDDEKWIQTARQNSVAPIMVITNIRETGGFSSDIAHALLNDGDVQNNLINNVVSTMQQKNYYGLNIDFEYIYPYDRQSYNAFLRTITARMHELGYIVLTAVAPKVSGDQSGLLYEAHDYPAHGEIVDKVILMTYEWGYLAGPPQAVAPLNQVRRVVEYAVSVIPRDKILLGIPNYGYDWTLPYVRGTLAQTFSNTEAVNRAYRNRAEIRYDETAKSPYYNYYDAERRQHIVWFEDARSIRDKLLLVNEFGLAGISYWTIARSFPQNLLVLNSMFNITKVL